MWRICGADWLDPRGGMVDPPPESQDFELPPYLSTTRSKKWKRPRT